MWEYIGNEVWEWQGHRIVRVDSRGPRYVIFYEGYPQASRWNRYIQGPSRSSLVAAQRAAEKGEMEG